MCERCFSMQFSYFFFIPFMGSITFYTFMFEDVGTKLSSLHVAVEIVTKSMLTVMH
jgi:hypothetical protein